MDGKTEQNFRGFLQNSLAVSYVPDRHITSSFKAEMMKMYNKTLWGKRNGPSKVWKKETGRQ
jgi:hypothetical protein